MSSLITTTHFEKRTPGLKIRAPDLKADGRKLSVDNVTFKRLYLSARYARNDFEFQLMRADATRSQSPRYFRPHFADRSYRYDLHNVHKWHLDVQPDLLKMQTSVVKRIRTPGETLLNIIHGS